MKKIIIIGAGGNSKVILDILNDRIRAFGDGLEILGLLDDDTNKMSLLGHKVLGRIEDIPNYSQDQDVFFINGIGSNQVRRKIHEKYSAINFYTAIHPSAIIGSETEILEGSIIMPGAIINSSSKIGRFVIINTGAIIEHDNQINDFVHIASGAITAGNVGVGSGTLLGSGSKVLPGIKIGDNCTVGAGAVVINDLPEDCTAVGVPAKNYQVVAVFLKYILEK